MPSITVKFDDIYSKFLDKIKDYDFISENIDESYVKEQMCGWIKSVKSMPRVRKLFSSLSINSEEEYLEFEMRNSVDANDEEADKDFVVEVFGTGMAWKWSEPQYKSTLNTLQVFGGKEEKFYSQSQQMAELKDLYKNGREELYKLIRDYSTYNNSYLGDES